MSIKYGKVIVDNRASKLDRLFTYIIDESIGNIIEEGMRVIVPFGRGNKIVKGIVIHIEEEIEENYNLKSIIDVLDDKPIVSKKLLELGIWMKNEYLCSYIEALQPILPPGDYKKVYSFVNIIDKKYKTSCIEEKNIMEYLLKEEIVLLEKLKKDLNIRNINKYLNDLEEKKKIEITIDVTTTVKKKKEKWVRLKSKDLQWEYIDSIIGNRAHRQRAIAEYIYNKKEMAVTQILEKMGTTLSTLRNLEKKNIIVIFDKEVHREPIKRIIPRYRKHILNPMQEKVFNRIVKAIDNKSNENKFLIHGITGSGKTEIYLQLVEEMLSKNKDSIILVPEISLTPQTIDRFVGRFGDEVAILHSRLSQGERFDQWRKIKEGKVKIVVGARSAIFAPFKNLGLIIIDEEHESTYKSSQNPKYNTIEVAAKRTELDSAILVLGTATPSIETYYKTSKKEIVLLELTDRVNRRKLPKVLLVDMRKELEDGNKSVFSRALYEEIINTLNSGKQVILFLNRRGFSTFVTCRKCGYVAKCNSCDISMTYYRNINKLRCHYCGATEDVPSVCPVCNSKYIKHFGIGTEKIEELTKELFPKARIERMDSDTTISKGSYERILRKMKNKEIDILIGTQMISKGLDFEDVTLVGIIAADTTLNLPDYKSPEKSFQLVTQVAGRSGRGDYPGKVILQTYNPEHYSIVYSKNQDYISFYNAEIPLRKEFLYPPFINLISILIYGEDKHKVGKLSKDIYNIIGREIYNIYGQLYINHIIGPNPAPLEKIKNNFRWQILLKIDDENIKSFKTLVKWVCIQNKYNLDMDNIKLSIDINPNSIL
ncbi:primosomal protein N' [Wansuia hejianensis]|uniref:Replication restart protein PriA n=1 Tax=Wansuia hejianensis TaxID=2763667 RepID=A0A926EY17_9FIRM|nr:primosomal protein N' [Wansuia hejianensis]MBC8590453.1 primosomal protein N' [Wansuia hejianensis]